MNAPNDNAAAKRLREWWASPPRSGMQRLINPWEYRHLRVFGVTRFAGGSVAAAAGVVCLSCAVYGWAAFFLVLGALNLAGGCWYITIARSAPPRAYSATSRPSWRSSATKPATNLIWASVFGLLAQSPKPQRQVRFLGPPSRCRPGFGRVCGRNRGLVGLRLDPPQSAPLTSWSDAGPIASGGPKPCWRPARSAPFLLSSGDE